MEIADNILKHYLRNCYFINGTPYAGKSTMCALLAENPARLYGAYPRKGVLAVGSDADIVVLDPNAEGVFSAAQEHSAAGYTPYEGMARRGAIERVYLRGQLVVKDGELVAKNAGQYIARGVGAL